VARKSPRGQASLNPIRFPLVHSTSRRSDAPLERRFERLQRVLDLSLKGFTEKTRAKTTFPTVMRPRIVISAIAPTDGVGNCKNASYEIEQCRKREYNNSRINQGNFKNFGSDGQISDGENSEKSSGVRDRTSIRRYRERRVAVLNLRDFSHRCHFRR